MTSTAVRVALRVRPLTQKEQISNCTECISFIPNQPQILIGKDHSFTYDYVFDTNSKQQNIYDACVVPLVEKFVDGFNTTILAYGQTGSGKTFSMGTALEDNLNNEQKGIIPRFINDLFKRLEDKQNESLVKDCQVSVSFLELYNEDFIDLLNIHKFHQHQRKRSNSVNSNCEVQIREDIFGQIYWTGVKEEICSGPEDLLRYLTKGSLSRTTGSTDMNSISSRSHAIFSVILKQTVNNHNNLTEENSQQSEPQTIVSKFHFVDLAGSERLKRTKAEGHRAREGISINSGLLALGNVISALGDESRKSSHVPYRDSKLTRLLQDSLGGNSQTLMIACVSPSDSNFIETLSTLKYANRARNIKNKVSINQQFAGSSMEVNQLRAQVAKLKFELNTLRRNSGTLGLNNNNSPSDMMINNMFYTADNNGSAAAKALKDEIDRLKSKLKSMSDEICRITVERDSLQLERELAQHLNSPEWPNMMNQLNHPLSSLDSNVINSVPIISHYQKTIQDLRNELSDTQERLAFSESIRAPLMHAMTLPPSVHVTPHTSFKTFNSKQKQNVIKIQPSTSTTSKRRNGTKKRRALNGNTTTTTKSISFKSTKRPTIIPNAKKVQFINNANDNQDIESWLKETLGSIKASESTGLRTDAKNSISNAKLQIENACKVLEEFKSKESEEVEYSCDILNDNELFVKLQSEDIQTLFDDIDKDQNIIPNNDNVGSSDETIKSCRSRVASSEMNFSMIDDRDVSELCEKYPQLHQMFNQIQSDIQVNEELVHQLEKTEVEYSEMRKKFEKKLFSLRDEILELRQQQQQEKATNPTTSTYTINHIRHAYEGKMKNLMNQLSELRRKYAQTSNAIQSSRNQNESMLRSLRGNVQSLKEEKRRMIKRMKEETERVKERMHNHEREIQRLRRKQTKDNEVKKRLEREVKRMELIIEKKTDESIVTAEKLKSLVQILKKAVREGGVLDEKMLASCASLLDIGSALVHSAKVGRFSRNRRVNNISKNRHQDQVPLEIRASKKKELLDHALYQFIQGKQAVEEMKQLLAKRNDLAQRKIEYMSERELLIYSQDSKDVGSIDLAFIRVIDENIDAIEAEISYINARIHAIHNDAAAEVLQEDEAEEVIDMSDKPVEKRVTFAEDVYPSKSEVDNDDDDWLDMDAIEERYTLPSNASPEQCLEMISKILKLMTKDETSYVMESVIDDIVLLRMEEYNNKNSIQQLEKSAQDLRRTLIVMKKAAIDTTVENEKRFKRLQLQQQQQQRNVSRRASVSRECCRLSTHSSPTMEDLSDADSAIDILNEDSYQQIESMFEKIYTDGINGKLPTYEYAGSNFGMETIPSAALMQNELSPYLRPQSAIAISNHNGKPIIQAPMKPSASPLSSNKRNSMSSPEQFLLQFLQTPLDTRPPSSPLIKPSEFSRYQHERESSTNSSVRSHTQASLLRRSSIQSDNGSNISMNSSKYGHSHQMMRASSGSKIMTSTNNNEMNNIPGILNRRRAFSFQQSLPNTVLPPTNSRRSSMLRELSNPGVNPNYEGLSPPTPRPTVNRTGFTQDYSNNGTQLIPAFNKHSMNSSILQSQVSQNQQNSRSHSILAMHAAKIAPPRPPSRITGYPSRESSTASSELQRSIGINVFDRLSNSHTHASQAKKKATYRYSSSCIDDLKKQWDTELSLGNEE